MYQFITLIRKKPIRMIYIITQFEIRRTDVTQILHLQMIKNEQNMFVNTIYQSLGYFKYLLFK